MIKFAIDDLVTLKSGGPVMTVVHINTPCLPPVRFLFPFFHKFCIPYIRCSWFDNDEHLKVGDIAEGALEKYEENPHYLRDDQRSL